MATLHLLGCGTPTPSSSRFGTSYVLCLDRDRLMFDCGPATTYKLVRAGLWPTQIDYLFFTHHHFDHNADYPCFLLCRWDQSIGKENRLNVFGPRKTEQITRRLIGPRGAFTFDWRARVNAPVSQCVHRNRGGTLPRPAPDIAVTDVDPGIVVERPGWAVHAARAQHVQPWLESLAYRVVTPGGCVFFAGDTGLCPSIIEAAAGADVLVVNCWDHQDTMESNGEAPGQTGTRDAAHMARAAGARMLVLTHIGARLATPEGREHALAEISSIYAGQVVFGEEMTSLELW